MFEESLTQEVRSGLIKFNILNKVPSHKLLQVITSLILKVWLKCFKDLV